MELTIDINRDDPIFFFPYPFNSIRRYQHVHSRFLLPLFLSPPIDLTMFPSLLALSLAALAPIAHATVFVRISQTYPRFLTHRPQR